MINSIFTKARIFISSQSARRDALNLYGRMKWQIEQQIGDATSLRVGLVYGGPRKAMYGLLCRIATLPVLPMMLIVANNQSYFNDEVHQERIAVQRRRPVENKHIGQRLDAPAIEHTQIAAAQGVKVTAILSARSPELALAADLFEQVGDVIKVLDTDGSSAVENIERILRRLIAEKKADAFFTCGSNRLLQLMKRLGRECGVPGQAAMEQIMACGLGPCYICVRTFEVNGRKEMRRVCVEGPVFDLQEVLGW